MFDWTQWHERLRRISAECDSADFHQMRDTLLAYPCWGDLNKPGPVRASFGLNADEFYSVLKKGV